MAAKIVEAEEQRMFNEMNEQQALKAEQRYQDDRRKIKERREATVKVLDQQVRVGVCVCLGEYLRDQQACVVVGVLIQLQRCVCVCVCGCAGVGVGVLIQQQV